MNYHASTFSHSLYWPLYECFLIEQLLLLANAIDWDKKLSLTHLILVLKSEKCSLENEMAITDFTFNRRWRNASYSIFIKHCTLWCQEMVLNDLSVCMSVCFFFFFLSTSEIYELITTGDYHSANQVSQSANPTHQFCAELTKLLLP